MLSLNSKNKMKSEPMTKKTTAIYVVLLKLILKKQEAPSPFIPRKSITFGIISITSTSSITRVLLISQDLSLKYLDKSRLKKSTGSLRPEEVMLKVN